VQATLTKLYVHWAGAVGADDTDAYVRGMLVRESDVTLRPLMQIRASGIAKIALIAECRCSGSGRAQSSEPALPRLGGGEGTAGWSQQPEVIACRAQSQW